MSSNAGRRGSQEKKAAVEEDKVQLMENEKRRS